MGDKQRSVGRHGAGHVLFKRSATSVWDARMGERWSWRLALESQADGLRVVAPGRVLRPTVRASPSVGAKEPALV